jgi:8-oxo-dGTP pyrophosphatase MutT (NUDIX family)
MLRPLFLQDILLNLSYGKFWKRFITKNKKCSASRRTCSWSILPPYRPVFTYDEVLAKNPKFAAVNIVLYLKDNEWYFPLIQRTINEHDRHSGQISLPGGKREEMDRDFAETAVSETSEEIGIDKHYVRIIREMSPIYIPPSNFYVYLIFRILKRILVLFFSRAKLWKSLNFPSLLF